MSGQTTLTFTQRFQKRRSRTNEINLDAKYRRHACEKFRAGFSFHQYRYQKRIFRFMEMAVGEMVHKETLDCISTRSLYQSLQSNALVSALEAKSGARSPHSQVIPLKGMSGGKMEIVASKGANLIASLSPPDNGSSSKASDVDSAISDKHKNRVAG